MFKQGNIYHHLLRVHRHQSLIEEIFNSLTHAVGALLSITALIVMLVFAAGQHSALKVVSCAIFGGSLVLLYTSSALYHAAQKPRWKHFCNILDHITIYVLIAGTYTPIVLIVLEPAWGWTLFGLIWGFALAGTVLKIFFTGRYELISVIAYLGMGWLAVLAIKPIYNALPIDGFLLLISGGLAYTIGVIFYALNGVRFAHTIWHLFVLSGSACHFFLILDYVIPH